MNLLQETLVCIKDSGHEVSDIIFIGSEKSGHSCTWSEYEKLAHIEYDSGFGAQVIADDLVIVFSDYSKMCRDEYDGNEDWEYTPSFKMPINKKKISTLCSGHKWASLEKMNEG